MKTEFPLLTSLVMNGELPALPPQVKLIEAQEATDKYWLDETDSWSFKRDFGCMTPPYPFMWIESTAQLPKTKPVKGKIVAGEFYPLRMGFKVSAYNEDQFRELVKIMRANLDLEHFAHGYMFEVFPEVNLWPHLTQGRGLPASGYLTVDEYGEAVQYGVMSPVKAQKELEELRELMWAAGMSAFFAISMMNCRNVEVESRQTIARRAGKKTRRKSKPSVEYHAIKLPAPKASGGGSGELTGTTKMHTARGHFKTYTEDAPLMGRHVGTYYWGWQVRGRKENGEVISSYKVGV